MAQRSRDGIAALSACGAGRCASIGCELPELLTQAYCDWQIWESASPEIRAQPRYSGRLWP